MGRTFAQFVTGLALDATDAAVSPDFRFLAGNHDHHLWSRARGQHFVDYLTTLPHDAAIESERYVTHLLPANDPVPIRDRFVEVLAARAEPDVPVTVTLSYPNVGLTDADHRRAVVLSHGHFVEPLYRMMSLLDLVFDRQRPGPPLAWHLEADNGGWIDFFWLSMGDSGDMATYVRALYESLQSKRAIDDEIKAIRRSIERAGGHRTPTSWMKGLAADAMLRSVVDIGLARERHLPETLSAPARKGLMHYLQGPVAQQVSEEIGTPEAMAFVFGHTHKPFIDHTTEVDGMVVPVVNTGGWVVDSEQDEEVKGAAVVLIDADLNIAVLRCYLQGPHASSYRLQIDSGSGPEANPLVEELREAIDPSRDPWLALSEAIQATVTWRQQDLAGRLAAQDRLLEHPDDVTHRRTDPAVEEFEGEGAR